MIESVRITDNKRGTKSYLHKLPAFRNGKEYRFTDGVNILIGKNGCGKSTLIRTIKDYLSVDGESCGQGVFGSTMSDLYNCVFSVKDKPRKLNDGIDVFADYRNNTFCMLPFEERTGKRDDWLSSFQNFGLQYASQRMSKGQKMRFALSSLFGKIFDKNAQLEFDYKKNYGEYYPEYIDYIEAHKVEDKERVWTILMDEPDCSIDIENLKEIYSVLSYKKEHTQIIAAIHNPFLIAKLAQDKDVNIIEMSYRYLSKIKKVIKEFNQMK